MFLKKNNKETRFHMNKKGFSLVEVLIAIGILVLLVVPLAMNMISSSRMNSRSKQISSASDINTSILEIMQSIDLSDVMTDVNGYDNDEYGTELKYTITDSALKNFTIGSTAEVLISADGKTFSPVAKQEDVGLETLVTSSIRFREVNGVKKAYFVGQNNDNYSFVLRKVENEEMSVDILAIVRPEQRFSIVNLPSLGQSDVSYVRQDIKQNAEIAAKFATRTNGERDAAWFLENMERTITINIVRKNGESVTIEVDATYSVSPELDSKLTEGARTISVKMGSFTTNSTAEVARGLYMYYHPLTDFTGSTIARDHFIINNRNELALPVYLITMGEGLDQSKYHPELLVNEYSQEIYTDAARTKVCSNIPNANWRKTLTPAGSRVFEVRSIGNSEDQQTTLYSMEIRVYQHREESFDKNGVFTPRDKDLLIKTDGSFIDTSEKIDIESDESTGITPEERIASIWRVKSTETGGDPVYNGTTIAGVGGNGVSWAFGSVTEATNAGEYSATATPLNGYTWIDGTNGPKTITWKILPSPTASLLVSEFQEYNGSPITGVTGINATLISSTTATATSAGSYSASFRPNPNFCWEDGTSDKIKTINWKIYEKTLELNWAEGPDLDVWDYDGHEHSVMYSLVGIISVDGVKDDVGAIIANNSIVNVGSKVVEFKGFIGEDADNYRLSAYSSKTHTIRVRALNAASISLSNDGQFTYKGEAYGIDDIVSSSRYVEIVSGYGKTAAGNYELRVKPQDGYTWDDGKNDIRSFSWRINPVVAELKWGISSFEYDYCNHFTTCTVGNLIGTDVVTVRLSDNNTIINVGSVTVEAMELEGPDAKNYVLPDPTLRTRKISVTPKPNATCTVIAPIGGYPYQQYKQAGLSHSNCVIVSGVDTAQDVNFDSNGNVISYTVVVKPDSNFSWADTKTTEARTFQWKINPITEAFFQYHESLEYTGKTLDGIYRIENASYVGIISAISKKNDGEFYTAILTPEKNYVWREDYLPDGFEEYKNTCAPITVQWTITSAKFSKPELEKSVFEYNGESHSPALFALSYDYFTISGTTEATDVGKYKIILTLKESGMTWGAEDDTAPLVLEWEITPKQVSVAFDTSKNTWQYDGKEHIGTAIIGDLLPGEYRTFLYENNKRTIAGKQTFTVAKIVHANSTGDILLDENGNPIEDNNYCLPKEGLSSEMEITQIVVGIQWGTLSHVYDGTKKTVIPTPTNLIAGDDVSFIYSPNPAELQNVGKLNITISALSGADSANYKLPTSCTATLEITKKPIEVDLTIKDLAPTYTGSTVTGVWYDPEYVTLVDGVTTGIYVDEYSATFALNPNYIWTNGDHDVVLKWYISKAAAIITTKPTAKTLTYNGSDQKLVSAATANCGTIKYSLDGIVWSNTIPTAKNAGTYKVYYYTDGDDNHSASDQTAYVTVTIAQGSYTISTKPTLVSGLKYNGSARSLITAGSGASGTIQYRYQKDGGSWSSWSTSLPSGKDAGSYKIEYQVLASADGNRKASGTLSLGTVTIAKATHKVTLPTANNQTYSGSNIRLVSGGSCSTGTITYSLKSGSGYTTTIPTRSWAGVHKVYVRVDGSDNYFQYDATIEVTIAKKSIGVTAAGLKSAILDESAHKYGGEYHDQYCVYLQSNGFTRAPLLDWSDYSIEFFTPNYPTPSKNWQHLSYYVFRVNNAASYGEHNLSNYYDWGAQILTKSEGKYTINIRPLANYCWSDGSEDPITIEWRAIT